MGGTIEINSFLNCKGAHLLGLLIIVLLFLLLFSSGASAWKGTYFTLRLIKKNMRSSKSWELCMFLCIRGMHLIIWCAGGDIAFYTCSSSACIACSIVMGKCWNVLMFNWQHESFRYIPLHMQIVYVGRTTANLTIRHGAVWIYSIGWYCV